MKFKKLVASATLLASAAVLFAGCGSSSNSATKDENKISFWAWDETFNIKAVNEAKKSMTIKMSKWMSLRCHKMISYKS